jgi:CDP-6-deoxy-D-xylo-4-hexulose-3-dehydrase
MGFLGISKKFLNFINKKKIFLIEDTCESHGVELDGKKAGTLGGISNFSFYYAHHMSTIEGGMISTNSKEIDSLAKMKRGHGLLRDSQNQKLINKVKSSYEDLNSDFIFFTEGFNLRNNELSAVIGIEQIKRLNQNIKIRNQNHKLFLKNIRKDIFFTDFDMKGSSNYGLHLILKEKNENLFKKIIKILESSLIEYRIGSVGGGNQLRQPYLRKIKKKYNLKNFTNTEHMHFYSLYIGNYPGLEKNKIIKLCKIINSIKI